MKGSALIMDDWYEDSKACLFVAWESIKDVENYSNQAITKKESTYLPVLNVRVKNALENCRSPLDYAAVHIFETYCRGEYSSKKDLDKNRAAKPQFPITNDKKIFEEQMSKKFKNLNVLKPKTYEIIEKYQPYNDNEWLNDFTELINSSKHRKLEKQSRAVTTHIDNYLSLKRNIHFENVTIVGDAIGFSEGPSMQDELIEHLQKGDDPNVKMDIRYFFSDTGFPEYETLYKYYTSVNKIIEELAESLYIS